MPRCGAGEKLEITSNSYLLPVGCIGVVPTELQRATPMKGQEYDEIADSYIIFVCMEDIFGRGLYRYTFENTCQELPDLKLGDGVRKVFLNTKGTIGQLNEDAREFLDYVEGQVSDNAFVKQLEAEVALVKSNKKWRAEYVKQYVHDRVNFMEGKNEGKREGKEEGKKEREIEIVKDGLENNISIETISLMTGLSIEDINELKAQMEVGVRETICT